MKSSLKENIKSIQTTFGNSNELIVKELECKEFSCAIVYLIGLTDTASLSKFVIDPLLSSQAKLTTQNAPKLLPLCETTEESEDEKITSALLKGKGILLFDKSNSALVLGIDKFKERAITEPPTSTVLKGPRAGFVESLKTNLSVIRKILATPDLRTHSTEVGKYTRTTVTIVYIDSIADKKLWIQSKNAYQKLILMVFLIAII